MKATINGIDVEGTPAEIMEFHRLYQLRSYSGQDVAKTPNPWIKTEIGGYTWNGPAETSYVTKALQNEVT